MSIQQVKLQSRYGQIIVNVIGIEIYAKGRDNYGTNAWLPSGSIRSGSVTKSRWSVY